MHAGDAPKNVCNPELHRPQNSQLRSRVPHSAKYEKEDDQLLRPPFRAIAKVVATLPPPGHAMHLRRECAMLHRRRARATQRFARERAGMIAETNPIDLVDLTPPPNNLPTATNNACH